MGFVAVGEPFLEPIRLTPYGLTRKQDGSGASARELSCGNGLQIEKDG